MGTNANVRGMIVVMVNTELRRIYYGGMRKWAGHPDNELVQIRTFVFEAFDESWIGSAGPEHY